MKVKVKNKLDTVNQLHSHEYDPDCEYCSNNTFVQTAEKARQELPKLKLETQKLLESKSTLQKELETLKGSVEQGVILDDLDSKLSLIKQYQSEINVKTITRKSNIGNREILQKSIKRSIDKYYENKRSIVSNNKINENITKKDLELESIKDNLSSTNSKFLPPPPSLFCIYSGLVVCLDMLLCLFTKTSSVLLSILC